jgi:glycosyltransferase involved in cell wall biosynthesis
VSATEVVTAIVPTYNKAKFLRESVQSVLAQTYAPIQIVIVDDGSTDESVAVAQTLVAENPGKIRLLQKPNGGISDARNFAIAQVSTKYILCLDGDDLALPTFVQKGMDAIQSQGANLVCCDVELFGAETSSWEPQTYDRFGIRYNNNIPTLVLFDRRLWVETGGYKRALPFNEDWEFFVNASRYNLQVRKLPEKLFRYRVTHEGLAQNYIKDSWPRSVSLMVTSNNDLYPVEQVLWAHERLSEMPQNWIDRLQKQSDLHPNEWLLHFWIGLATESKDPQRALDLFSKANSLSGEDNWQPLFRIARLIENMQPQQAVQLYHAVRVCRPDMERLVREKLEPAKQG